METINLVEIAKAKKTLKEIEFDFRTIERDSFRILEIWEFIAMQINSNLPNDQRKFWKLVMDLYHYKYSEGRGVSDSLKMYLN